MKIKEENLGQYTEKFDRIQELKEKIIDIEDPELLMLEIMDHLKETELVPEVGGYYTFIYNPKTPNITYDQHPLVACTSVERWGFKGINFHWNDSRNYTWEEIPGRLHVIQRSEIDTLRSIPYAKYLQT